MKKIKFLSHIVPVALVILTITGCAGGPKYGEVSQNFPPLNPDQGRIFMYRSGSMVGSAVQPSVMLNEQKVGAAVPGGFFFIDRPAGDYQISTTTEVKRNLSLTLDKGQTRYVRFNISMGFMIGHVWPELMEPKVGEAEIQKCSFTGTTPHQP